MDREDAEPILTEWLHKVGAMIGQGMTDVGTELRTELTSGIGEDYVVEVTSGWGRPGLVLLEGRICPAATGTPVLEIDAEMELDTNSTAGDADGDDEAGCGEA